MKSNWRKYGLGTLVLALAAAACDGVSDRKLTGPEVGNALFDSGGGYTVVREKDTSTNVVTGIIDASGGRLVIGKHELWVPKDAVSGPTTFTMTRLESSNIAFSLTATQVTTNDIGSRGFNVPLKLVLSYEDASEQPEDPANLVVGWLKVDGTIEVQVSEVNVTGKRVTGTLNHFSDYALVYP